MKLVLKKVIAYIGDDFEIRPSSEGGVERSGYGFFSEFVAKRLLSEHIKMLFSDEEDNEYEINARWLKTGETSVDKSLVFWTDDIVS